MEFKGMEKLNVKYKNLSEKYSFLFKLIGRIKRGEISVLSASLSYYFILSIFPLLLVMMSLLSYFPINTDEVFNYIYSVAPDTTGDFIVNAIKEMLVEKHTGILYFGILTSIYSASTGIFAIMKAVNFAFGVKDTRNWILKRLVSIFIMFMVIGVILLFICTLVFGEYLVALIGLKFELSDYFYSAWAYLKIIAPLIFAFFAFNLVYIFSVNLKMRFRDVYIGSAFSTLGIVVISKLFSIYVSKFSTQKITYGSVGTVMLFVVWLFLIGFILILGSEINAILFKKKSN